MLKKIKKSGIYVDNNGNILIIKYNGNYHSTIFKNNNIYDILFEYGEFSYVIKDNDLSKIYYFDNYKNLENFLISEIGNLKKKNIKNVLINNKFVVKNNDKIIIDEFGNPLKLDFIFPSFKIFPLKINGIENKIKNYILRDTYIPFTYVDHDSNTITGVYWIINYNDDKIFPVNYPFNTNARRPCTKLKYIMATKQKINQIHWYTEIPSNDIPSIKVEYLPFLLFCLKNNHHELIPLCYKYLPYKIHKINLKFDINVKIKHKNEICKSINFEGKITTFRGDKSYYNFIIKKYNGKILKGEIEIEPLILNN